MQTVNSHFSLMAAALGIVLLLLVGCDNTLEPFAEETGVFSIYGILDVRAPSNYIRVKHLNDPVLPDTAFDIDATVVLTDLDRGTTDTLAFEIMEIDDLYVHNFRTDKPLDYDSEYRLTATRSDGATTTAIAHTPPLTETEVRPEGANCERTISVQFHDVASTQLVEPSVGFEIGGQTVWIGYAVHQTGADRVGFSFRPESALQPFIPYQNDPFEAGFTPRCTQLSDDEVAIRYTVYSTDFIGMHLPVSPLEARDVENGIGFLGGSYTDSTTVQIDTSRIHRPGS